MVVCVRARQDVPSSDSICDASVTDSRRCISRLRASGSLLVFAVASTQILNSSALTAGTPVSGSLMPFKPPEMTSIADESVLR